MCGTLAISTICMVTNFGLCADINIRVHAAPCGHEQMKSINLAKGALDVSIEDIYLRMLSS